MDSQVPPLPANTGWIDTPDSLTEALAILGQERELAFDTEADSYYVYHVKVCLLQVSGRDQHFLIDPLAVDLAPLGPLFADPEICTVWHAGSNDLGLLRHRYGFEFRNLFDTMLAAQVLGLRRPGLAALLLERFGIEQKKTYQTSDWRQRPLSPGQLHYAVMDTAYLLELKDQMEQELRDKGRLEEAQEDFDRLRESSHTPRVFDETAFWRVRGARELEPKARRRLAELYRYRESVADRLDRSPHRVMPDRVLLDLAQRAPRREADLRRVRSVTPRILERHTKGLLQALEDAHRKGPLHQERAPRDRSRTGEPPLTERQKRLFESLRAWRRQRAEERDVDESRIATTGTLRNIAREEPASLEALGMVAGVSPFRVREYGEEILQVVQETT